MRIFHSYRDVTNVAKGCRNLDLISALKIFDQYKNLKCATTAGNFFVDFYKRPVILVCVIPSKREPKSVNETDMVR